MTDTVSCTNVANWWDGKVIIDEIKIYADKRGMVSEVWRIDSLMGMDSKQCYISETAPYIQRGPHEHAAQSDFFVSWKNNMVYQMFNPETNEMKIFVTEKSKIYRIYVSIGIVHSYRNVDCEKSFTLNFPTSLFMGVDKKEPIDEIRHEDKHHHNDVIVVFGASGKLGKAITSEFFAKMGEHTYDVIPSYEKLKNEQEVETFFKKLDLAILPTQKVYFFNCASLTNVQDVNTQEFIWEWSNVEMPVEFLKKCNSRNWQLIQFSTDYVFQKVENSIINYNLSSYTRSKIRMEQALVNTKLDNYLVFRVANLFAENDNRNFIYKLTHALKKNGSIKVDPRIRIFPSNVVDVAAKIHELYKDGMYPVIKEDIFTSLVPSISFFLHEFVRVYLQVDPVLENGRIQPWHPEFEKTVTYVFDANIIAMRDMISRYVKTD